jgi:hypothetical protein
MIAVTALKSDELALPPGIRLKHPTRKRISLETLKQDCEVVPDKVTDHDSNLERDDFLYISYGYLCSPRH